MVQIVKYIKYLSKITAFIIFMLIVSTYLNGLVMRPKIQRLRVWNMNYDPFNSKRQYRPSSLKYILIWSGEDPLWDCLEEKQIAFQENNCEFDNCYITRDREVLGNDTRNFDAIVINGKFLGPKRNETFDLPNKRVNKQLFIFGMRESADNYPMCSDNLDNYFNLTWTYRLDSDAPWPYISVIDNNNREVAPNTKVDWVPEYKTIINKDILQNKEFTATWFVSNCYTVSRRESFFNDIKFELNRNFKLKTDVVGGCGSNECPMEKDDQCLEVVKKYYFYFAFENSFAADYVTEKVTRAMLHDSVPVVYGAADYNRFLPPHSYIDAKKLGAEKTAETIAYLIKNETAYLEYFQWRNYYKIMLSSTGICNLCTLVNKGMKKSYTNFRHWWNRDFKETCKHRLRDKRYSKKSNMTRDEDSQSNERHYKRLLVRHAKTDFISKDIIYDPIDTYIKYTISNST